MDDAVDVTPTRTQPVAAVEAADVDDVPVAREPVVERVEVPVRRWSRAAFFGLVLGLLSVAAWLLTNGSLVTWNVPIVPGLQWIGLVTAVFGLLFSMIGLGQRKHEGRGYAVLGLLLSVIGLVVAQVFWANLVEVISSGFMG